MKVKKYSNKLRLDVKIKSSLNTVKKLNCSTLKRYNWKVSENFYIKLGMLYNDKILESIK